jgi:hypothetical protein
MHSASAGLEHLLFPELVESDVLLTNAKGVYRCAATGQAARGRRSCVAITTRPSPAQA